MKQTSILILLFITLAQVRGQEKNPSDTFGRVVEMNEVIINAQRQTLKDQVIHFFRANQSSTLEEIMSRLPELSMIRRGPYGMEPTVRSFSSSQINVLIDGMKIHGACTDKMDPPTIYIEPANLENLSVQSAAQGIAKGSAIGGTINLQLQQPTFGIEGGTTVAMRVGFQSASRSLYESVRVNYNTKKWAFLTSGTFRKAREYLAGGHQKVPFSQYKKVNYSVAAIHRINETSVLKFDLLGDDGWNIGYPSLPMDVGYAATRLMSATFNYRAAEKQWENIQFKIYANEVRHFMDDTHRPNTAMHMDMPGKSMTAGFFGEGNMKTTHKSAIRLRIDGSQTRLRASMTMYQLGQLPMFMLTWPDNSNNQLGGSLMLKQRIGNKVDLVIAARVDVVGFRLTTEEAKDHMEILRFDRAGRRYLLKNGSASLIKAISSNLITTAALSYAERAPNSSELFGFFLYNAQDGYDHMGNPFLNKEESVQAEWNLNYSTTRLRISTSLFAARLTEQIQPRIANQFSPMTLGAPGVKQYNNMGAAHKTGAEAMASTLFLKTWTLIYNFRYWYGVQQGGRPLPFIAPMRMITSLKKSLGNHFVQLETEYASTQKRIDSESGEDKTPAYLLWNIRCQTGKVIKKFQINIQLGVENLFDKRYHEHLDWNNVLRPGRNGYLLLNVRI